MSRCSGQKERSHEPVSAAAAQDLSEKLLKAQLTYAWGVVCISAPYIPCCSYSGIQNRSHFNFDFTFFIFFVINHKINLQPGGERLPCNGEGWTHTDLWLHSPGRQDWAQMVRGHLSTPPPPQTKYKWPSTRPPVMRRVCHMECGCFLSSWNHTCFPREAAQNQILMTVKLWFTSKKVK